MKVTASELRIGNIHEGKDFSIPRMGISTVKVGDICPVAITLYGIQLVEAGVLEFIPVIITKDWFLKWGFMDVSGKDFILFNKKYMKSQKSISVMQDQRGVFYVLVGVEKIPLKYVHKFQNLFFELTEEELAL